MAHAFRISESRLFFVSEKLGLIDTIKRQLHAKMVSELGPTLVPQPKPQKEIKMLSKSNFRIIIVLLVLGAALVTFAFVNLESGKRSASNQIVLPFTAAEAQRQYELRYAGTHFNYDQVEQLRAEAWTEKYGKPAQPDVNVLTGQAAAEAWAEKYAKPVQPDLDFLTGQTKAEAWAEKYGKPAQPDLKGLTGQSAAEARLEELGRIKDDVIPADAGLIKASRLEELAKIKDGD